MPRKQSAKPTTSLTTVAIASEAIAELDKGHVQKARQLLVSIAQVLAAAEALVELDRGNELKARRLLRRTAGSPVRQRKLSTRREKSPKKKRSNVATSGH